MAEENVVTSIAFPFTGTGIYGYPRIEAAQVAISTQTIFPCRSVEHVVFCFYLDTDLQISKQILRFS